MSSSGPVDGEAALAASKASKETDRLATAATKRCLVYCRLRPSKPHDYAEGAHPLLTLTPRGVSVKDDKNYEFDGTFGSESQQSDIFDASARPCVLHALNGYRAAIMAYGQTGTGKTFTMCNPTPGKEGIIPRAASFLFDHIAADRTRRYEVEAQFIQIYRDNLGDLMTESGRDRVDIYFDKEGGVTLPGCSSHALNSADELMQMFEEGNKRRVTTATAMNPESSRGHSAFVLWISSTDVDDDGTGAERCGKLTFIDLAGYERFSKTGISNTNPIMKDEARTINASLLSLGHVVSSLSNGDKHIPWRNAKLTRLLQDSVGGRSRTTIILTVGPSSDHLFETTNTLQFGQRSMAVKVQAKVTEVVDYAKLANKLQSMLTEKQDRIDALEMQVATHTAAQEELFARQQRDIEQLKEQQATEIAALRASGASDEKLQSVLRQQDVEKENLLEQQREELEYETEAHDKKTAEIADEEVHNAEMRAAEQTVAHAARIRQLEKELAEAHSEIDRLKAGSQQPAAEDPSAQAEQPVPMTARRRRARSVFARGPDDAAEAADDSNAASITSTSPPRIDTAAVPTTPQHHDEAATAALRQELDDTRSELQCLHDVLVETQHQLDRANETARHRAEEITQLEARLAAGGAAGDDDDSSVPLVTPRAGRATMVEARELEALRAMMQREIDSHLSTIDELRQRASGHDAAPQHGSTPNVSFAASSDAPLMTPRGGSGGGSRTGRARRGTTILDHQQHLALQNDVLQARVEALEASLEEAVAALRKERVTAEEAVEAAAAAAAATTEEAEEAVVELEGLRMENTQLLERCVAADTALAEAKRATLAEVAAARAAAATTADEARASALASLEAVKTQHAAALAAVDARLTEVKAERDAARAEAHQAQEEAERAKSGSAAELQAMQRDRDALQHRLEAMLADADDVEQQLDSTRSAADAALREAQAAHDESLNAARRAALAQVNAAKIDADERATELEEQVDGMRAALQRSEEAALRSVQERDALQTQLVHAGKARAAEVDALQQQLDAADEERRAVERAWEERVRASSAAHEGALREATEARNVATSRIAELETRAAQLEADTAAAQTAATSASAAAASFRALHEQATAGNVDATERLAKAEQAHAAAVAEVEAAHAERNAALEAELAQAQEAAAATAAAAETAAAAQRDALAAAEARAAASDARAAALEAERAAAADAVQSATHSAAVAASEEAAEARQALDAALEKVRDLQAAAGGTALQVEELRGQIVVAQRERDEAVEALVAARAECADAVAARDEALAEAETARRDKVKAEVAAATTHDESFVSRAPSQEPSDVAQTAALQARVAELEADVASATAAAAAAADASPGGKSNASAAVKLAEMKAKMSATENQVTAAKAEWQKAAARAKDAEAKLAELQSTHSAAMRHTVSEKAAVAQEAATLAAQVERLTASEAQLKRQIDDGVQREAAANAAATAKRNHEAVDRVIGAMTEQHDAISEHLNNALYALKSLQPTADADAAAVANGTKTVAATRTAAAERKAERDALIAVMRALRAKYAALQAHTGALAAHVAECHVVLKTQKTDLTARLSTPLWDAKAARDVATMLAERDEQLNQRDSHIIDLTVEIEGLKAAMGGRENDDTGDAAHGSGSLAERHVDPETGAGADACSAPPSPSRASQPSPGPSGFFSAVEREQLRDQVQTLEAALRRRVDEANRASAKFHVLRQQLERLGQTPATDVMSDVPMHVAGPNAMSREEFAIEASIDTGDLQILIDCKEAELRVVSYRLEQRERSVAAMTDHVHALRRHLTTSLQLLHEHGIKTPEEAAAMQGHTVPASDTAAHMLSSTDAEATARDQLEGMLHVMKALRKQNGVLHSVLCERGSLLRHFAWMLVHHNILPVGFDVSSVAGDQSNELRIAFAERDEELFLKDQTLMLRSTEVVLLEQTIRDLHEQLNAAGMHPIRPATNISDSVMSAQQQTQRDVINKENSRARLHERHVMLMQEVQHVDSMIMAYAARLDELAAELQEDPTDADATEQQKELSTEVLELRLRKDRLTNALGVVDAQCAAHENEVRLLRQVLAQSTKTVTDLKEQQNASAQQQASSASSGSLVSGSTSAAAASVMQRLRSKWWSGA